MTDNKDEVLTMRQAAKRLNCSPRLVSRLFDSGELRGFLLCSQRRVFASSVEQYIELHANQPPRQPAACDPTAKGPERSKRSRVPGGFRHFTF